MTRFLALWLLAVVCSASVSGQYFSAGWAPGQTVASTATTSPESTSTPATTPSTGSFLEKILSLGPFADLFSSVGVNITEKLAAAAAERALDGRVPLITDENYDEMIVKEALTEEEERDRVWFLVITLPSDGQESVSRVVDKAFDEAFNETIIANDLPHVRWGRIDYMNVTYITTKWAVWQAPYIVVLKDRGQTLRFWRASQLRVKPELIRDFLKIDGWKETPPWNTAYSPGGSREWLMEYLAVGLTAIYNKVTLVPKMVLWMVSGVIGSLGMSLLHRKKPQAQAKRLPKAASSVAPEGSPDTVPSSGPRTGGAKQRKSGKK